VRYEYDQNDRMSRAVDPDGHAFVAGYDPTHNLTSILYPNMTSAAMTYDAAGRLTGVENKQDDGEVISRFRYTLDPAGNRTQSDEYYRWHTPRDVSRQYAYDPLYRLVASQDSEGRSTQYVYDAAGNRLQLRSNYDPQRTPTMVDPYTVDYAYNAANQLLSTSHSVFGVTDYAYDDNGNRIRRQGPDVWTGSPNDILRTDYVYDYENRLTWTGTFRDAGNGNWQVRDESSMAYDGYGRLFRRMHDMHQGSSGQKWTEFVYDGLDPIVEYVDPSPQYTNYYRGLSRILESHDFKSQASPDGTASFYHYDGLGSVSAMTKHRGQSAHEYAYWDYGMVLDKNDGSADSSNFERPHNHYTYTGQEWEEYTRLYHFYAREYEPETGVWLQQDPYRGRLAEPVTLHRYGYVGNDPLNFVDAHGFERDGKRTDTPLPYYAGCGYTMCCTNYVFGQYRQEWEMPTAIAAGMSLAALKNAMGNVPQITLNRIQGNAFRDEFAELLRDAGRDVRTEVYKWTPFGKRYIDIEVQKNQVPLGGIETKTGQSPYTVLQRTKDLWLRITQNYPVNVVRKENVPVESVPATGGILPVLLKNLQIFMRMPIPIFIMPPNYQFHWLQHEGQPT
jgi:RHS repeat-associated protein